VEYQEADGARPYREVVEVLVVALDPFHAMKKIENASKMAEGLHGTWISFWNKPKKTIAMASSLTLNTAPSSAKCSKCQKLK
jgi:hypothetical protein